MILALVAVSFAHGPALLHEDGASGVHLGRIAQPLRVSPMQTTFQAAAAEFGVPESILAALAFEATRFDPTVTSTWGGWTMFDLRDDGGAPSLDEAGRLVGADPNALTTDWRLSVRGVAALLADNARTARGGALPPAADLLAWYDAVRAFSGRQEPSLQDMYARYVFELVATGAWVDTPHGRMVIEPQPFDVRVLDGLAEGAPPPTTPDSSFAYTYTAACTDNYSDYSRGPSDIDVVVIHTTQGSYSGSISWYANCSSDVSAHYTVRSSDGQITQSVREQDVAWHAGNWDYNLRSVGIEHEGWVDEPDRWYTDAMYASSAALVLDINDRQGVPLDRSHIVGHVEVPGATHTDPGSGWDWDYYMSLINGDSATVGGDITGVVADQDIYNGARLVGAEVWISETGDATTVDVDGYFRFEDIPYGSYTLHARYPGYAEGTCTKTTSSSSDWCSIALFPDDAGDEPVDTDADDPTGPADPGAAALPGESFRMLPMAGGCAVGGGVGQGSALAGLLGVGLVVARRRRA